MASSPGWIEGQDPTGESSDKYTYRTDVYTCEYKLEKCPIMKKGCIPSY